MLAVWLVLAACADPTAPRPGAQPVATPEPVPAEAVEPPRDGRLHLADVELVHEVGELRVERQGWRLDDESGTAIRIRLPRGATMQVRPADTVTPFDDLLPTDAGPWVAVNGGFYDAEGHPMGLVVRDGEAVRKLGRSGSGVLEQGPHPLRVVHRDAWKPGARSALQSIDRLVDDGAPLVGPADAARRAARTGIALTDDAVYVVLAFADDSADTLPDGLELHATAFRGLPLWAFARYLVDAVGAEEAINLDGAVSTQVAVRGGGRTWRVVGEAGTVQAVVFRP